MNKRSKINKLSLRGVGKIFMANSALQLHTHRGFNIAYDALLKSSKAKTCVVFTNRVYLKSFFRFINGYFAMPIY